MVRAIAVLTVALEIAAYLVYRNSIDGQAGLVNVAILVFALIAVVVVRMIDAVARRARRP